MAASIVWRKDAASSIAPAGLVARASVEAAVAGHPDLPVQVELSGPWPPFSFAGA